MATKRVTFSPTVIINDYELLQETQGDWQRQSVMRSTIEKITCQSPETELQRMCDLIASWRQQSVTILLGNLGRNPFLLQFYLDLCFNHTENVKIQCFEEILPDYQIKKVKEPLDFLFIIEPYFGFHIYKHHSVKHTVVLTSHLSLYITGKARFYNLQLFNKQYPRHFQAPSPDFELIKPLPFHLKTFSAIQKEAVILDVTSSRSAHEAYLRLLTGLEMIGGLYFRVKINQREREIIQLHIKKCQNRAELLWENSVPQWIYEIHI